MKWFLNFISDCAIPFIWIVKGVCVLVDMFINNQALTDFVSQLDKVSEKVLDWNGKEKSIEVK